MNTTIDNATALLARLTGDEPEGLWSAPGRVNLIGEHTDYNEGFVLPFAIDRRAVVAVRRRADHVVRVASTFADEPAQVDLGELDALVSAGGPPGWAGYPLGVAWALRQHVAAGGWPHDERGDRHGDEPADLCGLDLAIDSDVPVGSGLSSSAAIECAVAMALNELWGLGLTRPELALVGQRAENDVVGAPTGIMDQSASLLGRPDAAVLLDCRSQHSETVDLGLAPAGLVVLVIDTRVTHAHATGGYAARRAACERAARTLEVPALRDVTAADLAAAADRLDDEALRRARHVVTENARVQATVSTLREQGPRAIGDLLLASHASLRDDFEVTVPQLDVAVEAATAAGALGARMTGGGFGGCALALAPADTVETVRRAVLAAYDEHGFITPQIFDVIPSEGARRE
ncbi:MAG: galactokinase [Micrococcales bacterium]|nr:galactokinase [Micrococcales bacterium]